MKIKTKVILFFSLLILIALETINNLGLRNDILKQFKYGLTILVFVVCIIQILVFLKNKQKIEYTYELKRFFIVFVFFVIISVIKIHNTKNFTNKTVEELIQLATPILYTFFVVNIMKLKDIIKFMKIALFVSIIAYIFSIGLDKFTLNNFLSISLKDSYSPFESAAFAEVASSLSAFFIYYRRGCAKYTVTSFVFCFLVFKRALLLQALILVLLSIGNLSEIKVKKIVLLITQIGFCIATLALNFMLQQENADIFEKVFKSNPGSFTMGRVYRLWYPLKDFQSYGFGSTSDILKRNLELDLIKILMELGIIALIIFIYCYFEFCRYNLYSYAILTCTFINLLFASSLTSTVGWVFRMICIASVYYKSNEWKMINKSKKRYRIVLK